MNERVPYGPETVARIRGSQMFFVNPNVTNEGVFPAVPGSIVGYHYKLPFTAHNFPVRRIRIHTEFSSVPGFDLANPIHVTITLRKADGTYLLNQVPACTFVDAAPAGASLVRNGRPVIFGRDFYPDPKMCSVQWSIAGVTDLLGIEFLY